MKQEDFLEKLIAAAKDAGADVTVITPNKEKELIKERAMFNGSEN